MWSACQTTDCPNNSFMENSRLGSALRVAKKSDLKILLKLRWKHLISTVTPGSRQSLIDHIGAPPFSTAQRYIYESNRKSLYILAEQKRLARKKSASNDVGNIPCPNCKKTFRAQIGLFSHLRTHNLGRWKVVVIKSDGQHTHRGLKIYFLTFDWCTTLKIWLTPGWLFTFSTLILSPGFTWLR